MNDNFAVRHPELWKFIKFNITVIVTSAIDIISYLILLYFIFKPLNAEPLQDNALLSLLGIRYRGYLFSYLISTLLGYISAYFINRKITFRSNINPIYSSVLYTVLAVFNILVSSYIGGVFGSFITAKEISTPVIEIISKFIIINIPTLWTYPVERYVIQIKKKDKRDKEYKTEVVIATDLDGTLLTSDNAVSYENFAAIERLAKKGIKIVILTGRTFYEIPFELRTCGYIDYFVYSNGAGIQSAEKGIVYYSPLERTKAEKIYDILNSYEAFIEVYSNQIPFADKNKFSGKHFDYYKIDKSFIPELYKSRKTVNSLEKLLDDKSYKTEMFDVFFRNNDERTACRNRLLTEISDIEITTSMKNNLEIMSENINKGTGLEKLCQIAGYSLDSVIVLGDSKNDISAFKTAKKCFAVSNACKEIKDIADKVICSNDENIMCYMENEV